MEQVTSYRTQDKMQPNVTIPSFWSLFNGRSYYQQSVSNGAHCDRLDVYFNKLRVSEIQDTI